MRLVLALLSVLWCACATFAHAQEPPPSEPEGPPAFAFDADADPAPVEWALRPSDLARYMAWNGQRENWKNARRSPFTVYGHELRGAGQYFPAFVDLRDLPAVLAFHLPPRGKAEASVDHELQFRNWTTVRCRGTVTSRASADRPELVHLVGEYTLEGAARDRKAPHARRMTDGTATARAVFDAERGVLLFAEIDLSYHSTVAKTGDDPRDESTKRCWEFQELWKPLDREFPKRVGDAIDRGVAWLRAEAGDDGLWTRYTKDHTAGKVSLGIHALVASGVPRTDPAVAVPLAWLFQQRPDKTYDQACALMAVDAAFTPSGEMEAARRGLAVTHVRDLSPEQKEWVERTAGDLIEGAAVAGSWGYPNGSHTDASNTHYGVLGAHAAAKLGVKIDRAVWEGVLRYFRSCRVPTREKGAVVIVRESEAIRDEDATRAAEPVKEVAGYGYGINGTEARPSMTCAAITAMCIVRYHLEHDGGGRLKKRERQAIGDEILGAWAYLDANWAVDRNSYHGWPLYTLYALERAGRLDQVKRVGRHNWFFDGGSRLVVTQHEKGGWPHVHDMHWSEGKLVDTCFALLFLSRATAPLTGR